MCTTCGAGTEYSCGVPEFTPGFKGSSCWTIFSFLRNVLQIVDSLFVLIPLVIGLSVLQFMAFD